MLVSGRSHNEMGWLSVGGITGLLFLFYAGHTLNFFYGLFHPPLCGSAPGQCIHPLIKPEGDGWPLLQLRVYTAEGLSSSRLSHVHTFENFDVASDFEKQVSISLPSSTRRNGSLAAFVYLLPHGYAGTQPHEAPWHVESRVALTTWKVPVASAFNLIGDDAKSEEQKAAEQKKKAKDEKPVTHVYSMLPVRICDEAVMFLRADIPMELRHMIALEQKGRHVMYHPLMRIEEMGMREKHLVKVNATSETADVTISYAPASIGRLRLFISMELALKQLKQFHLTDDDLDEVKGIFVDTNPLLLTVTILVSALHLCFDFLAFKNDISFWRHRKTMVGLSTKTLVWRAISSTIVFFYLAENKTSMLVLGPSGLGVAIEYWKVVKALKVTVIWRGGLPRFSLGTPTSKEAETDSIDRQAMWYLTLLLIPLCVGGAIYSLLYLPHRSWRSWLLQTAANGVYAFGFLFMLPQLFLNYKLKSVAHLPIRAFMYKAFNTFIDDLFAFIITMPTAHRVACFRDDIVFLVYLYQRWLYPVDKKRVNEYGEEFGDENTVDSITSADTRREEDQDHAKKE